MKGIKINPYVGFFVGVLSVIYALIKYGHAIYVFYVSSPIAHEAFWFFCLIMFFKVLLNSALIRKSNMQTKAAIKESSDNVEGRLKNIDEKTDKNYTDIINKLFSLLIR